ncbi:hypothetical protein [Jeotgalibaca ciconiae]|uniref:hypothetical protein n=1 Tax=Jeotgalibaca ciconiae TaxID=2496265 RepID=UPI002ACB126A|nr:hypothetical protein [Jeotgalibaca ciconiae]
MHKENHSNVQYIRTNTGALEIIYGDERYVYRIEKRTIDGTLPTRSYRLKKSGEINSLRSKYLLDEDSFLFDELAEPFRDRLILAMADSKKARSFIYDRDGRPIHELGLTVKINSSRALSY